MATPTTGPYGSPALDDFNRAGTTSPPSGSWTTAFNPSNTALALAGDTATVKGSGATFNDGYWNVTSYGPDVEAWMVCSTLPTGTEEVPAIYVRGVPGASATAYEATVASIASPSAATISRENSPSTFPALGATITLPAAFAANDGLALVAIGSSPPVTLELWHWDDSAANGWIKAGTRTDDFIAATPVPTSTAAFLAAGRIALEIQSTTTRVTIFGGGNISIARPQAVVSGFMLKTR